MTGDPDTLLAEALEAHGAGGFGEALRLCDRVLALAPLHPDAYAVKGLALRRMGRPAAAERLMRATAAAAPDHLGALLNLADLAECDGRSDAAVAAYRRALALDPGNARALSCLARLHERRWELEAATAASTVLAVLSPDRADAYAHLGIVASVAGRPGHAAIQLRRAVRLNPGNAALRHTLGLALATAEDAGAAGALRGAVVLDPGDAKAWCALGDWVSRIGAFADAPVPFRRAAVLHPHDPAIRQKRVVSELRTGRYAGFWDWWDAQRPDGSGLPASLLRIPRWEGQGGPAHRLLVTGEEGIGDEVLYASCLPDAIARPGHVTVACNPRLARLFARSFPTATVIPGTAAAGADADHRIGIASLPRWFRGTPGRFPDRRSFLAADPAATAAWRALFAAGGDRVVGIAWHSVASAARSVPLPDLAGALAAAGTGAVTLVSLQYGDHAAALGAAAAATDLTIVHGLNIGLASDLDDHAAQVAACDLVVTIDNTTANMAGALGVETWVLLPTETDFRWEFERSFCPWYPSVRLFRQARTNDWSAPLERVRHAFALWRGRPAGEARTF